MKKISYYLIAIIVAGSILVSVWIYKNYFEQEEPGLLFFKVERGSIQEVVKVRGEVVAQKEFDLEFPFSGIVEKIFIKEGQQISAGVPLIKLETTDFDLEIQKLNAQVIQVEANLDSQQARLDELTKGTRQEEIQIQEVKVKNASTAIEDARNGVVDKLKDSYTKSDDAVRNEADQFFSSPRSQSPQLTFSPTDTQLETDLEWERILIESTLKSWKTDTDVLAAADDLASYIATAKNNLNQIKLFLDKAALALNGLTTSSTLSQTNIDTWKSDISTARTNVNTAINNLTVAEEKLKTAESGLALAKQELALKKAGTVEEQITAQEAQVKQAEAQVQSYQAQIAIVREKIKKSTLYAPISSRVVKIWLEKGEIFSPNQVAVSLSTTGYKIQADISELEIGNIKERAVYTATSSNDVLVRLDAFPDAEFIGKVVSIEQKEVIKEGDKYYRANIYYMEPQNLEIRSGMNADLIIRISSKENVLKIPELAVYQEDGKKFVTVLDGEQQKEVEIKTGISDGESVEVITGLDEGQIVIVSAD